MLASIHYCNIHIYMHTRVVNPIDIQRTHFLTVAASSESRVARTIMAVGEVSVSIV